MGQYSNLVPYLLDVSFFIDKEGLAESSKAYLSLKLFFSPGAIGLMYSLFRI